MGEILWKVVGIEGEPLQGLGWREPRPPGGRHCPAWEDEIRLGNREGIGRVEAGGDRGGGQVH